MVQPKPEYVFDKGGAAVSQSEATVQYAQALKAGQKTYKECVLSGRYPYL